MTQPPGKETKDIAEAYDSPPWWYDIRGFFILTFAYNSTLWNQLRVFGPHMGDHHLEVACGTGTLLDLVLKWRRWKRLPRPRIVGVDYADAMLEGARRRFRKHSGMEFHLADAANLPFPDASFDTANIANAVHCFPDVDGALADVCRVLKPGGTLAANVLLYPRGPRILRGIANRINRWGMRKGILHTPYEQDEIRQRLIRAGFEVVAEAVSGNCYNVTARRRMESGTAV